MSEDGCLRGPGHRSGVLLRGESRCREMEIAVHRTTDLQIHPAIDLIHDLILRDLGSIVKCVFFEHQPGVAANLLLVLIISMIETSQLPHALGSSSGQNSSECSRLNMFPLLSTTS